MDRSISISLGESFSAKRNCHFEIRKCNSLSEVATAIAHRAWSPIIWRSGYRNGDNFIGVNFAVFDFDSPGYSLNQCISDHQNIQHVIGTTKSHQKEKNGEICDRFRLVIPFAELVDQADRYKVTISRAIQRYSADSSCSDLARFFFPCKTIVSVNDHGSFFEVVDREDSEGGYVGGRNTSQLQGKMPCKGHLTVSRSMAPPAWVLSALRSGVPTGSRHHMCLRIAVALFARGFSEDEIVSIVSTSPFGSFFDISAKELERTISNGVKWVTKKIEDESQL